MYGFLQFVPQKVCLSCDGCCRFKQPDSSWRPKAAQEEIGEGHDHELDGNGYIRAVECRGQVQCMHFQAEGNTCGIYERRPFECRLYPFLLMKRNGAGAIGVHLSCPYIQQKRQEDDFKNYVEDLKRYFHRRETLEFIQRNQLLLGDYSDYEQEVEYLFDLQI